MDAFIIMVRNVLLFALLAVPGYVLVKCKLMKQEHSAGLSKILMYVGMPFLVISGTVNNLVINLELLIHMLIVALIGIGYTLAVFFASKPLSAIEKEEKAHRMMRFCMVFSNNGFLGLPLAIAVFGKQSYIFTLLIVLNIINNVMMYSLGAYLVSSDRERVGIKQAFFNPVLISFVIGIILNLINIKSYVPEIVTYSDHFSGIVTPISMTILGMKMATVKLSALFTSPKTYYACAIKLIAAPVIIVALLFAVKPISFGMISADVITAFFVAFSMPTAGLASTFADTYGGDTDGAVAFTLGSTILSILTIPALFGLLSLFI